MTEIGLTQYDPDDDLNVEARERIVALLLPLARGCDGAGNGEQVEDAIFDLELRELVNDAEDDPELMGTLVFELVLSLSRAACWLAPAIHAHTEAMR